MNNFYDVIKIAFAGISVALAWCTVAYADSPSTTASTLPSEQDWAFKFTPSYYATTHESDAVDLNLRAKRGPQAGWLGYYQQGGTFEQVRTGYEYTAQPFPLIQLVPSLQLATHGFLGGSINAQIGDSIYALLGFGRTNTHDYYNLNFDPNDSVLFGIGTSLLPKSNLSLFSIKDDRLHTNQVVNHLVWRVAPDDHQRWTVDVSKKHGRVTPEDEAVSGNALTVTYDYREIFARLAWDKKVNFTAENQTRISLGLRF